MAETRNVCHSAAHAAAVRLGRGAARRCAAPTGPTATWGSSTTVRAAMPDAAITTDIIVGLPRRDRGGLRRAPCDVVREARFAGAFTFQYSKRPGTPAADDGRPGAQGRWCRSGTSGWWRSLEEITWAENKRLVGRDGRGAGRRGRGPQGRAHRPAVRPGPRRPPGALRRGRTDADPARRHRHHEVTYAAPHHLNADGPLLAHRRTRAGDAWAAGRTPTTAGRAARDAVRPARPRPPGDDPGPRKNCRYARLTSPA